MKIDSMSTNSFTNAGTQTTVTKAPVTKAPVAKPTGNSRELAQNSNTRSSNIQELESKPKNELSLSEKQWIDIISKANKALEGPHTSVEFSIHDKTKEIMVKVIDKETNKVLREFPPEKVLDLVAKMWEMVGIIVDERR